MIREEPLPKLLLASLEDCEGGSTTLATTRDTCMPTIIIHKNWQSRNLHSRGCAWPHTVRPWILSEWKLPLAPIGGNVPAINSVRMPLHAVAHPCLLGTRKRSVSLTELSNSRARRDSPHSVPCRLVRSSSAVTIGAKTAETMLHMVRTRGRLFGGLCECLCCPDPGTSQFSAGTMVRITFQESHARVV